MIGRDGSLALTLPKPFSDVLGLRCGQRYASSLERPSSGTLVVYPDEPATGEREIAIRPVGDLLGLTIPAGICRLDGFTSETVVNLYCDIDAERVTIERLPQHQS